HENKAERLEVGTRNLDLPRADAAGRVDAPGRGPRRARAREGACDGQDEGDLEGDAERRRGGRAEVAGGRTRSGPRRSRGLSAESERALQRVRDIALRPQGEGR